MTQQGTSTMTHQTHGESDMALEQEFEWVNAWASALRTEASAPSNGEAGAKPRANDARQVAEHAQTESSPIGIAQIAAADSLVVGPDAGRGTGRWTSLFRLASRSHAAQPDPAAELFVDAAPSPNGRTPSPEARVVAQDTTATIGPDQFARDIAEIQTVRDKLLAMEPALGGPFRVFALRTSDAVPILVGVVLAFTSMIVLAVAALFVSLR